MARVATPSLQDLRVDFYQYDYLSSSTPHPSRFIRDMDRPVFAAKFEISSEDLHISMLHSLLPVQCHLTGDNPISANQQHVFRYTCHCSGPLHYYINLLKEGAQDARPMRTGITIPTKKAMHGILASQRSLRLRKYTSFRSHHPYRTVGVSDGNLLHSCISRKVGRGHVCAVTQHRFIPQSTA